MLQSDALQRFLAWLGCKCFDIARLDVDRYLSRWVLWGDRGADAPAAYLHQFHRGDVEPYFHDHPWPFLSLILWGGYWEHTPAGKRWYGPGRLLLRPATWQHRIELPAGQTCWTLFLRGRKTRTWGFWCPQGWLHWRTHEQNQQAGKEGCG